jgi:hypothetical protein
MFKFTIGDRVRVVPGMEVLTTGHTEKSYALTYPDGFMVADLVSGIHGPDYHCEPMVKTSQSRAHWIEEKHLKELDTV